MFQQLTVLAPGLLGASVMMAARDKGLAHTNCAWSRRADTRLNCREQPWCDSVAETPEQAVEHADAVIVCAPVEHIVPLLERIAPALKPGAFVTDVGSTKSLICRGGQATLPKTVQWVGSHPMAGSEKTGLANARADLFDRRTCFVTPLQDTPPGVTDLALRFWRGLGMEVTTMSPEAHDEVVAHISHLPHLLATALCTFLSQKGEGWENLAGPGLADSTRIAGGDPGLWKEICASNREEILRAIQGFDDELRELQRALHNGDDLALLNLLERGKTYRNRLRRG